MADPVGATAHGAERVASVPVKGIKGIAALVKRKPWVAAVAGVGVVGVAYYIHVSGQAPDTSAVGEDGSTPIGPYADEGEGYVPYTPTGGSGAVTTGDAGATDSSGYTFPTADDIAASIGAWLGQSSPVDDTIGAPVNADPVQAADIATLTNSLDNLSAQLVGGGGAPDRPNPATAQAAAKKFPHTNPATGQKYRTVHRNGATVHVYQDGHSVTTNHSNTGKQAAHAGAPKISVPRGAKNVSAPKKNSKTGKFYRSYTDKRGRTVHRYAGGRQVVVRRGK